MIGPRGRAGAALVFTFTLGLIAGVAFERHAVVVVEAPPAAQTLHETLMADLSASVGLDDAQVEEVEAIMRKHHETVQEAWRMFRPEVQKAMQEVHVEIAETLRPDQRERFHRWLVRRRESDGSRMGTGATPSQGANH